MERGFHRDAATLKASSDHKHQTSSSPALDDQWLPNLLSASSVSLASLVSSKDLRDVSPSLPPFNIASHFVFIKDSCHFYPLGRPCLRSTIAPY
eukprot:c33618_g1_i1 orf=81-362(-)